MLIKWFSCSEELDGARAALKTAQDTLDVSQAELKRVQHANVTLETEMKDVQNAHTLTQAELKSLQDTHALTEAELKRFQDAHALTLKQIGELEDKYQELQTESTELQVILEEERDECRKLADRLDETLNVLDDETEKRNSLQHHHDRLKKDHGKIQADFDEIKESNRTLGQKAQNCQSMYKELEKEMKEYKKRALAAEMEVKGFQNQFDAGRDSWKTSMDIVLEELREAKAALKKYESAGKESGETLEVDMEGEGESLV